MWTPATRRQHSREGRCYETDLTEAKWDLIAPLMPADARRGRPRKWPLDTIWNAIFYVHARQHRLALVAEGIPAEEHGLWLVCGLARQRAVRDALMIADRERVGREASRTGAVLDSQSVRTAESGTMRLQCGQEDQGPQAYASM